MRSLHQEARERGCPDELLTVLIWASYPDEEFLKRKYEARKKFPDIAKRFDASFPNGIDPNMDGYRSSQLNYGKQIIYIVVFAVVMYLLR